MKFVDEPRAYILGLLVAGGTITPTSFFIEMPFDQWGNDAKTMNDISRNLITKTQKLFGDAYGIQCDFAISSKNCWRIKPINFDHQIHSTLTDAIDVIKQDLKLLGLPEIGFLLDSADLLVCKEKLSDAASKRFLTGIFDARASLTKSQRRFDDGNPMVSIEVPGSTMNFKFVIQLCSWMTQIGSVTDQINFNHPSIHASDDPTYMSWRKGFKIRLAGKSFFENHSFGIAPKGFDVKSLAEHQSAVVQKSCVDRRVNPGERSIHIDLEAMDLPEEVRGKTFLHYLHICSQMGCPFAPTNEVQVAVSQFESHVSLLPICSKGTIEKIEKLFDRIHGSIFPDSEIVQSVFSLAEVQARFSRIQYPEIEGALKFLAADEVFGNRYKGNGAKILSEKNQLNIELSVIDGGSSLDFPPIMMQRPSEGRAVLISSVASKVNKALLDEYVQVSGVAIQLKPSALKSLYE